MMLRWLKCPSRHLPHTLCTCDSLTQLKIAPYSYNSLSFPLIFISPSHLSAPLLTSFSPFQSNEGHSNICLHGGLPRNALPSAHLRASISTDDASLHGDWHKEVWNVQL